MDESLVASARKTGHKCSSSLEKKVSRLKYQMWERAYVRMACVLSGF